MKHYGIWVNEGWLIFESGQVFWTTSQTVAEAQLETVKKSNPDFQSAEIKEFD